MAVIDVTSWKLISRNWLVTIGSRYGLYGPVPFQVCKSAIASWRSCTTVGWYAKNMSCTARVAANAFWCASRLMST